MKGLTFGVLAAAALLSMEAHASNLPQESYYSDPNVVASDYGYYTDPSVTAYDNSYYTDPSVTAYDNSYYNDPSVTASEGLLDENVSLYSYSYSYNYYYNDYYYYSGDPVGHTLNFLWSILVLVCCCPVVIWYKCCYTPS